MDLLAEISDKVATIPEMWIGMGILGALLSMPGLIHRFAAVFMFAVGLFLSVVLVYTSYQDVYADPLWGKAVQAEMGGVWITHYLLSCLLPFVLTGVVLFWHLKKTRAKQAQ